MLLRMFVIVIEDKISFIIWLIILVLLLLINLWIWVVNKSKIKMIMSIDNIIVEVISCFNYVYLLLCVINIVLSIVFGFVIDGIVSGKIVVLVLLWIFLILFLGLFLLKIIDSVKSNRIMLLVIWNVDKGILIVFNSNFLVIIKKSKINVDIFIVLSVILCLNLVLF